MKQSGFDPSQSSIPPDRRVKVVPLPPPGHDTAVLAVAGALIAGLRHAAGGALIGAGTGAVAGAASDVSRQQSPGSWRKRTRTAIKHSTPDMKGRLTTSGAPCLTAVKAAATAFDEG